MKVLIYVTKAKPYLYQSRYNLNYYLKQHSMEAIEPELRPQLLNGKVVAEFEFGEYDEIPYSQDFEETANGIEMLENEYMYYITNEQIDKACITYEDLLDYGKGRDLYAIHLTKFKTLDKPMELGELVSYKNFRKFMKSVQPEGHNTKTLLSQCALTKAPQSYQYVYYKGEKCLLLPIHAEHTYNILQGKKTLEIRKSVPKEVR